ncbi:MAG: trans-sulfuration enzyme family protein [Planctomycetota bacterium]|jgi:cystathionine gamma-synthase
MAPERDDLSPDTIAAHGGSGAPADGPMVPPIAQTSIHRFATADDLVRTALTPGTDGLYTRYGNPTITACEQALAQLCGADRALLFGSGMAAISTALLAVVKQGDRVVMLQDQYGGTTGLMRAVLARFGVRLDLVPLSGGLDGLRAACNAEPTAVLCLESPTNPCNGIVDLKAAASIAHAAGALAMIDNTIAGPLGQQPLALGFDLECHSASKSLSGHSDLIAGVVLGGAAIMQAVYETRKFLGGVADPHAAFLLHRGLRTLAVRTERMAANTQAVAEALAAHPMVSSVHWCGLPDHPGHTIAREQMRHFGSLLAFDVAGTGDAAAAARVLDALRVIAIAPSLGGVESVAVLPAVTSHAALSDAERTAIGITPSTVRLSVGIEAADDLVNDLRLALDKA